MTEFRLITPQDIQSNPSYREVFRLAFGPFTEKKLQKVLTDYEQNANSKLYGLFAHNTIIGIIGYERVQEHRLFIKQIAVSQSQQGQGCGKRIVEFIKDLEKPDLISIEIYLC